MTTATVCRLLAGFFRIESILPLVEVAHKRDASLMFAVYCPRHGSRVLLFEENIEALINHPTGVRLHWRCTCGQAGMAEVGATIEVPERERTAG